MKKTLFSLLILLFAVSLSAQSPLPKGMNQFNAGVGFSSWGVPLYLGFDHGVSNVVSLGAELSFRDYSERWHSYKYHHSVIGISGNANYHFNKIMRISREWDLYAGINVGFYYWNSDDDYDGDYTSGLGLGAQVGGRYYFSKSTGINLEFGGGNAFSGGKIGISYRY